ncbi:serologically defined colon cancer antigen 8 homolog [Teleopsis dalmanni]|uniref:serologically defined colon cancer antigen 8 homolog n=1 Tax=Teleopsis dalmanni TaxID=139649 RepID=UPI0018CE8AAA|nr:serologically defined colon cancer antigen 8 homolog [Teleopsis dalmanni]
MKSSKGISKKSKTMDYTTNAYNEAVSRLKLMLADSYATPKSSSTYLRNYVEDSTDNLSDNLSVIDRPVLSDISKYLSTNQRARLGSFRSKKSYSTSKENLLAPTIYQTTTPTVVPVDYYVPPKPQLSADSVQAPVEIFNFIEKQEDYIEQLEKESKYCRNELTNLLGKVKDVINENEQLTENARNELATLTGHEKHISPSSDSDDNIFASKKTSTPRKKDVGLIKSPRYASAPNIVYEARISELEAELMQANIDLKRLKNENEDLKHKVSLVDPLVIAKNVGPVNCETHRKQIEHLQMDKVALEETVRQLQKSLDEMKAQQYSATSKRHANDLMQMERAQSELEVKHLRDELDRQHERVRELQHEMSRRIADERANAERRYNSQVDQLGGDLSNQWEQVAKLQLDLERQKRYETDLKRDLAGRNAQIEELKMELRSNRSTFLADMAQVNAEKQSLEQEITSLRLQLDRAARESKTESARLNAEISSLRQRLDRGDADLLHAKREVLRLNDEIANLEKELAYGELKNEIRPTKKDLDKRMSEMQEKHVETVSELEEMIQNQKQLMDKLTNECKVLTNRLEDTSLKHKTELSTLQSNVEYLTNRMLNNERSPTSYNSLPSAKASLDYKPTTFGTTDTARILSDYSKTSPYNYDSILAKSTTADTYPTATTAATTAASSYDIDAIKSKYETSRIDNGISDYKPSYSYGLDENDDENLKDNIGEGEKQQYQQQRKDEGNIGEISTTEHKTKPTYELNSNYNVGEIQKTDTNMAPAAISDYNNDYSGYEGYDQQQYDASAYDTTYDPQQYDGSQQPYIGNEQYDTSAGQAYDTNTEQGGGYSDYTAADYNTTTYEYDTPNTGTTISSEPQQQQQQQQPQATKTNNEIRSPPPATQPTPITSTTPIGAGSSTLPGSRTTTESRPQPRTSGGTMGSTSASGAVSGGKSNLPQQSATAAAKK